MGRFHSPPTLPLLIGPAALRGRGRLLMTAAVQEVPQQLGRTGKKATPKKSETIAGEFEERLKNAPDLAAVIGVLRDLEERTTELPGRSLYIMAISALQLKAAAAERSADQKLKRDAVAAGERLLGLASDGGKAPETAVTSMVRLLCSCGAPDRAMELIAQAQAAGVKPRLRTLAAILNQAAEAGERETCDNVWAELPKLGLEPQDNEFAIMLRSLRGAPDRQYEILHQMADELPLPSDPPLVEEIGRVFGVEGTLSLRDSESRQAEGRAEGGSRWRVGWTTIDDEGVCALSGRTLQAIDVSEAEEAILEAAAARLAIEPRGLEDDEERRRRFLCFRRWLSKRPPFDVVVDGANVGFNNQNREGGQFQYGQIDAVVNCLREAGRRVLLVLHAKWLREDADLSVVKRKKRKLEQISKDTPSVLPEDSSEDGESDGFYPHDPVTDAEREAAPGTPLSWVRSWKESGILVRVPEKECDDWYWLFAALSSARRGARNVQVVSNDHMRDHHWRMLFNRAFQQWQTRHMTRVCIWSEAPHFQDCKVTLQPPIPYSTQAQVSADRTAWHFPVPKVPSRAEQLSSGRPVARKEIAAAECHWLVAWRDPPEDGLT